MALVLKTAPSVEPVTAAEAKAHARVDITDDDTLITALIVAARRWCEQFTRRAFITQTWELYLDGFPTEFRLPYPPLQSITKIDYTDLDGATQTLATTEYTVDAKSEPGRVVEAWQKTWPATRDVPNAVIAEFKAGYGDAAASVPEQAKLAIKMLVAHLYENRESTAPAMIHSVPMATEHLLWPLRHWGGMV